MVWIVVFHHQTWWTMVFHMVKPCWNTMVFHMVVLEVSYGQSWGYWSIWSSIFRRFSIVKIVKQPFLVIPHDDGKPQTMTVSSRTKHGESSAQMKVSRRQPWLMVYIYYHK
jgi:hypothetical protein